MKSLFIIALFSCCFLMSCDTNGTTESTVQEQPQTPKNNLNTSESKIPTPKQPQKSALVESEVQIAETPVSDSGVDYNTFSKAICACAEKSNELNSKMQRFSESGNSAAFTEMVPKVSEAYDRSVACAKGQADALNSEYSMQKLIKSMKGNCGDFHDKLIWQIFLALKKG